MKLEAARIPRNRNWEMALRAALKERPSVGEFEFEVGVRMSWSGKRKGKGKGKRRRRIGDVSDKLMIYCM